jgi:RNA-binding protein YlmH
MVFLEGYDALPTDTLKNKYIKDFESLVHTHVLGHLMPPANWRLSTGNKVVSRRIEYFVKQHLITSFVLFLQEYKTVKTLLFETTLTSRPRQDRRYCHSPE